MDKIPPGAGMPGGAEGAFERFLTAALATIITIMFSWRLLAEEEEARGASGAARAQRAQSPILPYTTKLNLQEATQRKHILSSAFATPANNIREIDISDDENTRTGDDNILPDRDLAVYDQRRPESCGTDVDQGVIDTELVVYDQCSPEQRRTLEATPTSSPDDCSLSVSAADDSLTCDTLTTWDEYKWEEETGIERECIIKTRRSRIRDFAKNPSNPIDTNTDDERPLSLSLETQMNSANNEELSVSPSVPFSQRFANFEYKDGGGDSGYIDLYPDVESDSDPVDSSDDECVYEIQVSDSDSDSDDERGEGQFYGVTSLDTIMEEYESDVSEHGDVGDENSRDIEETDIDACVDPVLNATNDSNNDVICDNNDERKRVRDDNSADCDKTCDNLSRIDTALPSETSVDISDNTGANNEQTTSIMLSQSHSKDCKSQPDMLESNLALESISQLTTVDTPLSCSEANESSSSNNTECNVTLDNTPCSDVNSPSLTALMSKTRECDMNTNQDRLASSASSYANIGVHGDDERNRPSKLKAEYSDESSSSAKCKSTIPPGYNPTRDLLKLKLSGDEYKISEISDDSLPSSPVRTCALDNLTDEPFSDTESCSSGSVITVLSVKSNDSDNRTSDKISHPPVNKGRAASGTGDLQSVISNQNNPEMTSKYDNFSLVSGFLNDSLNSLLSANTGSEAESSSDRESSGPDAATHTEHNVHEQTHTGMNGKCTSGESNVSSVESLPNAPDDQIQNGHTTSSDSLDLANANEQNNNLNNELMCNEPIIDYVDSDASSDSSDPPLREYDPHDDDLAAFQFNVDSDDDSFFLVIGDEDNRHECDDDFRLRNFETFTNLNSVGLSPEYGDAVTSRAVDDDARGFTFSHTEDLGSQYKKRSYFTDRASLSDSESPGRGPLSPITSEDEDARPEVNEQLTVETINNERHVVTMTSYSDAEQSIPENSNNSKSADESSSLTSGNETIDFNKYIIKSDLSPIVEDVPFIGEEMSLENENKQDLCMIDTRGFSATADTSANQTSQIDTQGDKKNNFGENEMNNLSGCDEQVETLSSLTQQIQDLTQNDTSPEKDLPSAVDSGQLSDYGCRSANKDHVTTNQGTSYDVNNEGLSDSVNSETNIDDIFEENVLNEAIESTSNKSTHRETSIDDILEENSTADNSNSSRETNIDDIISGNNEPVTSPPPSTSKHTKTIRRSFRKSKSRPSVTNSPAKVETNIDDLFSEPRVSSASPVTVTSQPTVETNIDDIFDNDIVTPVSSVNIHAPPIASSSPRRETNIDDVIVTANSNNDVSETEPAKFETSIDDVINEIENSLKEESEHFDRPISYEHFVDDLIAKQTSSESSHVGLQTGLTSESAISAECQSSRETALPSWETSIDHTNSVPKECTSLYTQEQLQTARPGNINQYSPTDLDTQGDKRRYSPSNIDTQDDNLKQVGNLIQPDNTTDLSVSISPTDSIGDNTPDKSNTHTIQPDHKGAVNEQIIGDKSPLQSTKLNTDHIGRPQQPQLELNHRTTDHENREERPGSESELTSSRTQQKDYNANIAVSKTETLHSQPDDLSTPTEANLRGITEQEYPVQGVSFHDADDTGDIPGNNVNETELKIVEDIENSVNVDVVDTVETETDADGRLDSVGSSLGTYSDDDSLSSFEESYLNIQETYNAIRLQKLNADDGRVIRTPATKPSDLFGRGFKDLKGVKKRVHRHQLKKYTSVLQQPVSTRKDYIIIDTPERPVPVSRLKVIKSRERFLSAENLTNDTFDDKFLKHRTSLMTSTPRKYLKRNERELQSTESLPGDMSMWNTSYDSNCSLDDQHHSLPANNRQFDQMYRSAYSSNNSSFERSEYHRLHANCMFSPGKREEIREIRHSTKSLENMFDQLLRYGSVSSVDETDIDAPDNEDYFVSFQYPLERAGSMSALLGPSEATRLPRKPGKGRFANRKVPKSKSLQTLETNLDDVFASEFEQPGELKKTPSVHELRVSKSLSKLHVPDWFKKSPFSRSGSTQSLFTYAGRSGSTSTLGSYAYPPSVTSSPTPSVTPGSNTVIIQKRVTPSPVTPSSAKLLRAPMLPTTPEKAPIHNTPSILLPSDKYRKKDTHKSSGLKPITILPFAKIREMFERKAQEDAEARESPTKGSPTKDIKQRVHFEQRQSPTKQKPLNLESPTGHKPVQNSKTLVKPTPIVPDRKPILLDTSNKDTENGHQPRKQQVHFSDESVKSVSKSQEQAKVSDSKRQNGTTPSTSSSSTVKKPSSLRTSLPLPQFRFRRPGSSAAAKAAATAAQNTSTQSKKETTV